MGISSLQEYVLVSQEPRIEIFRRTAPDTWEYFEVREGNVRLASGPTLDLAVLYAELPL
jgi:Uma2 family endonuclease